jgi:hypothetical protein
MPLPEHNPMKQSASSQTYVTEYMEAYDRTESFGLKVPPHILVKKDCVNPDRALELLLGYFDRHTPEELIGQTLAINADLIALFWNKARIQLELTIGTVELNGRRYGECNAAQIRRYLDDKLAAWHREGVPFHLWLTSPACEVIVVTFAMNMGSRTRDECARRIIYKTAGTAHSSTPTYHPFLVGEDFLYQSGVIVEFGNPGPGQACD